MQRADDLREDLSFLRKREGFTPTRLHRVALVADLLRQNPEEVFERTRSRFVSAIYSLGEADADLLLDVFALSERCVGVTFLGDRRRIHARAIGRGIETVADREIPALDRLTSTLVAGTYAQAPLTISVPEMHNGIVYETTTTLITVENRLWKHTQEHYRFVATFDEMDFLTVTRSYPARASVAAGGAFRVNTRSASRGFNDHFWHLNSARTSDEPMRRGSAYNLKFLLEPDGPDEAQSLVNVYRAFHERSLFASIQVAFIGEVPKTLWKYERVSHFAAPGEPNKSNVVQADKNGLVSLRLRDVHGGLVNGVAWTW